MRGVPQLPQAVVTLRFVTGEARTVKASWWKRLLADLQKRQSLALYRGSQERGGTRSEL